ncbi:MAG: ATP-binding protein [Bacillota bacterium]
MYIKNLFIKDFGIFRISEIKGLFNGLNIIAGENRSGKTTLYKIMLNLGYGFNKGMNIPQPVNKYFIEAEIADNKKNYSLQINGYSHPVIKSEEVLQNAKLKKLYADLDEFSYQNIFGISLDYLRTFPVGYTSRELSKLQSVLIGAGFKQVKKIPEIKEKHLKEAKTIGGKYGRINVGEFKPYYSQIEEGLELQKRARDDFDHYYSLKKEKENLLYRKDETAVKITKMSQKLDFLDLLFVNYDSIEKFIDLKNKVRKYSYLDNLNIENKKIKEFRSLKEEYEKNSKEIADIEQEIGKISSSDIKQLQKILDYKNDIKNYSRNISFYLEKIRSWHKTASELKDEKMDIKYKFKNLLKNNIKTPGQIDNVLDSEVEKVRKDVDRVDSIKVELDRLNQEKINRENEKKDLKSKIKKLESHDAKKDLFFYSAALLLILSGILLSFFSRNILAGFLSIFSGIFILSYILHNEFKLQKEKKEEKKEKDRKLDLIKNEEERLGKEITAHKKELELLQKRLNIYRRKFYFPQDLDYSSLPHYVSALYKVQKQWENWCHRVRDFKDNTREIISQYRRVNGLYEELSSFVDDIHCFEKIKEFKTYNRHLEQFDFLENLLTYNLKLNQTKNKNKEILNSIKMIYSNIYSTDADNCSRIIEILEDLFNDYNKYKMLKEEKNNVYEKITYSLTSQKTGETKFDSEDKFEEIMQGFSKYVSQKRVEEKRNNVEVELKNLKKQKDDAVLKIQDIETRLNDLKSEEKLNESRKKIDKARKNLKKLAEKYAVNKLAVLMLNKLQQNIYKKIKDEYLRDASEIFKHLSSNDYKKIIPGDDLWSSKLDIVNTEDKVYSSNDMLSRGTEEQLFLSVRLSRIKNIKPPLPVIIDDSLVNFDIKHLERAVDEILKLSRHNQIILLTCHKRIIELLEKKEAASRSWLLKKGSFTEKNLKEIKREMSIF